MNRKDNPGGSRPEADTKGSLLELFLLFSWLGLSSFGGGVSAWMHRAFVEQRAWLSENEFAAALALGRIMPGANVANLAVIIGQRLRGAAGAVAAVLGLLAGPTLALIAVAAVYQRFAGAVLLDAVLQGTSAAAVGLLVAMGVSSGSHTVRAAIGSRRFGQGAAAVAVIGATFVLVGVLRFPTVATVLVIAPVSIAIAYLGAAKQKRENADARR
jgi:chromate transporter